MKLPITTGGGAIHQGEKERSRGGEEGVGAPSIKPGSKYSILCLSKELRCRNIIINPLNPHDKV